VSKGEIFLGDTLLESRRQIPLLVPFAGGSGRLETFGKRWEEFVGEGREAERAATRVGLRALFSEQCPLVQARCPAASTGKLVLSRIPSSEHKIVLDLPSTCATIVLHIGCIG
jgi:hypothetical protein